MLFDLHFVGCQYTWWKDQSGRDSIEEHLNRMCASEEWLAIFPRAMVEHLDEDLLDHLPLLLKTQPELNGGRAKDIVGALQLCEQVMRVVNV